MQGPRTSSNANAPARGRKRSCSLRGRWLSAFAVLAITTLVLAAVAMVALFNAKAAIQGFDERILPSVAKSLALSERVTHLAAAAPYVAEMSISARLNQEKADLLKRQEEVRVLAAQLPPASGAATGVPKVLSAMQVVLDDLIEFKRLDLALREEGRGRIHALSQMEHRIADLPERSRFVADHTLHLLRVALYAHNTLDLDEAERVYLAYAGSANALRIDAAIRAQIAAQADSIFALRRQHLALRDRKTLLLTSTRVLSEELTRSVDRHVAALSAEVSSREHSVGLIVRSGLIAVTLALLVAAAALVLGYWSLRESLRDLTRVTSAITELSHGNASAPPDVSRRDDEVGALVGAFNVFRDNTLSMRRMGADISEQRRLLRTVLDSIDDGLGAFDAEGRLVAWNPRFAALLRLPAQAIHTGATLDTLRAALPALADGRPAVDLLGPPDAQRRRDDYLLDNGQVLAVRNHPMPAGGFVTLYSDQSESRALERQVRQAQKMEVLGQLTGGVAHDFNNLLAAIFSNLQLLQSRDDLSPDMRRIVDRAFRASERGAVLTTRLLAFARRQTLRAEVIDVDQMLAGLQDLIEYSLGQGIRVELDLQADGACVLADGGQLENAILNLALNGGAAMPRGGVLTLHSAWHAAAAGTAAHGVNGAHGSPGPVVEIRISDTGHGMPPHVLEHIFEPFFSTKENEGSGLGLSIVYGFVKQSGGDLRVRSTVGQGTAFTLVLPEAAPSAAPACAPPPPALSLDALQVLLVDDDTDVRDATFEFFKEHGARVQAVASATDATAALERQAFDLVLSDVSLGPGGDGLQLMRDVQRLYPRTAVVLISGLPSDLLAHRYAVPPRTRILRKPFLTADLVRAIAQALAHHRTDAPATTAHAA
ncbi:Blue-light-activated protein [Variovorax boronicumulans]|uniref:hybrid sensor histidine kinase/response regulator n=1 Tax=Variovorax boronicumulans TaxID=436515 RepID=UPI000BB33E83|nr:ATP-binding protein [Variovorax boronicumulans]PBI86935.1 Blue-light-activated protein [Variovorax boronicumulans]